MSSSAVLSCVFTLPAPIGEVAFQNKSVVYAILFRTAAETLATIAANPRHLGAKLGMTMVLHTWGQTLQHHPHVHCVVPGGGPSLDGTRWVSCRSSFFLPVRVLSRLFRRLFLQELENAFAAGKLRFFSNLASLAEPQAFARRLGELRHLDWTSDSPGRAARDCLIKNLNNRLMERALGERVQGHTGVRGQEHGIPE